MKKNLPSLPLPPLFRLIRTISQGYIKTQLNTFKYVSFVFLFALSKANSYTSSSLTNQCKNDQRLIFLECLTKTKKVVEDGMKSLERLLHFFPSRARMTMLQLLSHSKTFKARV